MRMYKCLSEVVMRAVTEKVEELGQGPRSLNSAHDCNRGSCLPILVELLDCTCNISTTRSYLLSPL
jgi:hypothetical protein